jgi:hypothetical protein
VAKRMKEHEPNWFWKLFFEPDWLWRLFLIVTATIVALLGLTLITNLPNAITIVTLPLAFAQVWLAIRQTHRRRWSRTRQLAAFTILLILVTGIVARLNHSAELTEASGPSTTESCAPAGLTVGAEAPNERVARMFQDAYRRRGGKQQLGVPCNAVTYLDYGWHQNLSGDSVVLAAETSPQAYVLTDPVYQGWLSIAPGHGVNVTKIVGYPINEGVQLPDHGWQLDLLRSDGKRSAVLSRDGRTWYSVQGEYWTVYSNHHGPMGELGYPIANAETRRGGDCQQFNGGWLLNVNQRIQVFTNQPAACQR